MSWTPFTMGISPKPSRRSRHLMRMFVHSALAGENGDAVRVIIGLPEQILLANDFEVEVITPRGKDTLQQAARASVKDFVMPVLIGFNPPERLAKQKVITNITFYEKSGMHQVDYPEIIKQISGARPLFLLLPIGERRY
ncbi:hypothetical protein BDR03DRAFT_947723 [Suillus americanus]|nr:hypothetical protein BDR03DRAFT_947723 [Suillus americanus]